MKNNYWSEYWKEKSFSSKNLQAHIGRTVSGTSINDELWKRTVLFIYHQLCIDDKSNILDLCCGNGMLSVPLSYKCNKLVGVDISQALLNELLEREICNITTICADINEFNTEEKYTHVILYFSLQYFNESQVIEIFQKVFTFLEEGAVFYIGDIPDRTKLWNFANTKEYEKAYFDSIREESPKIGNWFLKQDLLKLANYIGYKRASIVEQPSWMYNSHYRFDMILYK